MREGVANAREKEAAAGKCNYRFCMTLLTLCKHSVILLLFCLYQASPSILCNVIMILKTQ